MTPTFRLPDYLRKIRAFEATESGLNQIPFLLADRSVVLKVDSIDSGRGYVLRRSDH